MKRKKLNEESDLTLLKEYNQSWIITPSINEIVFYTFMVALYYLGYARWLFWTILVLMTGNLIAYFFDKVITLRKLIGDELKYRGYVRK